METLVEAGAISQAEFDQAQTTLRTGRGPARGARRAGARGPRPAAVLPRDGTAGGHRRRHPGASRRSRHDVDDDHDDRRRRSARGLHPGAARSIAATAGGAAGATTRCRGQGRSRPTPSRSSRRASTTRRRQCSSRACSKKSRLRCASNSSSARASSGAARRASRCHSLPSSGSAVSISASSPNLARKADWSQGSSRCRSAS